MGARHGVPGDEGDFLVGLLISLSLISLHSPWSVLLRHGYYSARRRQRARNDVRIANKPLQPAGRADSSRQVFLAQ
jgi:hypothetical protein